MMKKIFATLLCFLLIFSLVACKEKVENSSQSTGGQDVGNQIIVDNASLEYAFNLDKQFIDDKNGFSSVSDLTGARFNVNGKYVGEFTKVNSRYDMKFELFNEKNTRIVNLSGGVAYTLPTNNIEVDYTIAKYRTVIKFDDSILSSSTESSNPYTQNTTPWCIYGNEWLLRHIINEDFYKNQNLTLLKGTECNFDMSAPVHNYGDTTTKPGFDIYRFDIKIEDSAQIERPYYNIAVVREINDEINFNLFVMKSKSNKADVMDTLVESLKLFKSRGVQRNYFNAGEAVEDKNWSRETRDYYRQISTSKTLNWGVFSYSITGTGLQPGENDYDVNLRNSLEMKNGIEEAMAHRFDIYPTYTHISWGGQLHRFNTNMSLQLAGGNGINNQPVLQFTYQFTTNNNIVAGEVTPMFDVLRGKYDAHFRQLAQDIKAYSKPILFRLNNEMNTDWTSYCGMMTLLDPDIFTMTWQRLYNIFIEEGVNNVIWIWNPIAISCPYSSWGEDLCYFPGKEYVHLIGATDYEMNNYAVGAEGIQSFADRYSALYDKNKESGFENWGVIISEFACGSGGDASGALGRNADTQAEWVKGMFDEFCKDPQPAYVQQLKGMVWFNCNDSSGGKVTNRLRIYEPNTTTYNDLSNTIKAFKDGFARLEAKYGK